MTKAEIFRAMAAIELFIAFILSYFNKRHEFLNHLKINLTAAAITLLIMSLFVE